MFLLPWKATMRLSCKHVKNQQDSVDIWVHYTAHVFLILIGRKKGRKTHKSEPVHKNSYL